jgi:hypothetical protein
MWWWTTPNVHGISSERLIFIYYDDDVCTDIHYIYVYYDDDVCLYRYIMMYVYLYRCIYIYIYVYYDDDVCLYRYIMMMMYICTDILWCMYICTDVYMVKLDLSTIAWRFDFITDSFSSWNNFGHTSHPLFLQ